MKAYQIQEFGVDKMKQVTLPDPSPGPGQVLLSVRAASLNFRDLLVAKGLYNPRMKLPRIPLSDGAGEIVATGAGVTRFKTGDRAMGAFMPGWVAGRLTASKADTALGGAWDGVLAETVALPETGVVRIPEHLSYEEAATLPCAGVTAWNALLDRGLRPGDTVLIQGTGGVSIFALQFAKLAGARVIGTSSSDEKLGRAYKLGLDAGINYKTEPDWERRVLQLTDGAGVDVVVEVGGAQTLPRSFRCTRIGGRISVIGVLSGVQQELAVTPILHRLLNVQGIYVGSVEDFEAMTRAIAQHRLRPVVDRVFSFDEAVEALHHMEAGAHFGKIVVRL